MEFYFSARLKGYIDLNFIRSFPNMAVVLQRILFAMGHNLIYVILKSRPV